MGIGFIGEVGLRVWIDDDGDGRRATDRSEDRDIVVRFQPDSAEHRDAGRLRHGVPVGTYGHLTDGERDGALHALAAELRTRYPQAQFLRNERIRIRISDSEGTSDRGDDTTVARQTFTPAEAGAILMDGASTVFGATPPASRPGAEPDASGGAEPETLASSPARGGGAAEISPRVVGQMRVRLAEGASVTEYDLTPRRREVDGNTTYYVYEGRASGRSVMFRRASGEDGAWQWPVQREGEDGSRWVDIGSKMVGNPPTIEEPGSGSEERSTPAAPGSRPGAGRRSGSGGRRPNPYGVTW